MKQKHYGNPAARLKCFFMCKRKLRKRGRVVLGTGLGARERKRLR